VKRTILEKKIKQKVGDEYLWVADWNEDAVIYHHENEKMILSYGVNDGEVELIGDPIPVSESPVYEIMKNDVCDYMPESTYKRVEKDDGDEENADKIESSILLKLLSIIGLGRMFANKRAANYNESSEHLETNEGNPMGMKEMRQALEKAGKLKDKMSDDDIKNAYDKLKKNGDGGGDSPASNGDELESIKKDVANMRSEFKSELKDLRAENQSLKSQLNAESEKEKEAMINDLESKDLGLEKSDLESMEINMLKKLHNKHCSVTNSLRRGSPSTNASEFEAMPEMEV
jgi:hypothetical protein